MAQTERRVTRHFFVEIFGTNQQYAVYIIFKVHIPNKDLFL